MNSNGKTLIPMSYLSLPQASCWAPGSPSAAAWQVIDIKELKDSEAVASFWSYTFLWSDCQICFWLCKDQTCFGLFCLNKSLFGASHSLVAEGINWYCTSECNLISLHQLMHNIQDPLIGRSEIHLKVSFPFNVLSGKYKVSVAMLREAVTEAGKQKHPAIWLESNTFFIPF